MHCKILFSNACVCCLVKDIYMYILCIHIKVELVKSANVQLYALFYIN